MANEKTRNIPPLSRRADVVPGTLNEEARTVEVVWTTGAKVLREQFWGDSFYEELSLAPDAVRMGRLQSGRAPVLDAHNSYSNDAVLGVVEKASYDAQRGVATLRFLKDDPRADLIWNKIRQGVLPNISVGYRIFRTEKIDAVDEKIPTVRAVDWEPHEISIVPVGADAGSYARAIQDLNSCVFATRSGGKGNAMADKEDTDDKPAGEGRGDDAETAEERRKRIKREREDEDEKMRRKRDDEDERLRRKREDEDSESRGDGDDDSTGDDDDEETAGSRSGGRLLRRTDPIEAEHKRIAKVYRMVDLSHLPPEARTKLARKLIEDRVPAHKIGEHVLTADRDRSDPGPRDKGARAYGELAAGRDAIDGFRIGAQAWLLERCGSSACDAIRQVHEACKSGKSIPGLGARERAFMAQDISFDAGEYRGMNMMELGRAAMALRGRSGHLSGLSKWDQAGVLLQRDGGGALAPSRRSLDSADAGGFFLRDIGGMNTTSDYPYLLENVLHKLLLAMYAITPDTWRSFVEVGSVVDFRAHPRYRMANLTVLSGLNEAGEFVNQSIPDAEKQSVTVGTVGTIIALSRQSLINDDLNAFARLAQQLGRACKLTPEVAFYAFLAQNAGLGPNLSDGKPLFDNTRTVTDGQGNSYNQYNVTTGAAIGVAAFDADQIALALMRDPSGNELLDYRLDRILISRALEGQVNVINRSTWDTDGTSGFKGNAFNVPNRVMGMWSGGVIGTARLSGTRRYMFADPKTVPCIEMAFLDGQEAPQLDWRLGFRNDGIEWRARLDYGLSPIDFRGCMTNAGA